MEGCALQPVTQVAPNQLQVKMYTGHGQKICACDSETSTCCSVRVVNVQLYDNRPVKVDVFC